MTLHDMCADIAALLNPMPAPDDGGESADQSNAHAAEQALQEREDMAEGLRMSWSEEDTDPLLSTLTALANAAGMSISGIRTAYDTDEIDQATEILQRPPSTPPQPAGDR